MQDSIISLETVWPSLVGALAVLRWFYYGICKMIRQSFVGLEEKAGGHEFLNVRHCAFVKFGQW